MAKTNALICDSCGKDIVDRNQGILEWYFDKTCKVQKGFRIVHRNEDCQYDYRKLSKQGNVLKDLNLNS